MSWLPSASQYSPSSCGENSRCVPLTSCKLLYDLMDQSCLAAGKWVSGLVLNDKNTTYKLVGNIMYSGKLSISGRNFARFWTKHSDLMLIHNSWDIGEKYCFNVCFVPILNIVPNFLPTAQLFSVINICDELSSSILWSSCVTVN